MIQSPPTKRPNLLRRAMPFLALAISAGFVGAPAWAQAPRAGTSIGNQATATYNDGSNIPRNVQSNSVTTLVQQVAAVDLTDPRTVNAAPGAPVAFPHTIQNNGNGTDSFGITLGNFTGFGINPQIFADANQDGVPDNNTPITTTPSLQPGEKFNFVVVGTVPAGQTSPQTSSLAVLATSANNGTVTDSNTDTVRVSNNAIVNVVKSVSGPVNGVYTYTLTYTNNSNVASGAVVLTDVLDSRLAYVAGSGRWSVSGTTALTDAPGGDPAGIDYSRNGQTVSATIATVAARTTGRVSFSVNVAPATAPGAIPNSASVAYDDDNDGNVTTPSVTGSSNNVDLTVAQAPAVSITSASQGPVAQGSTVSFTNTVTNGGNGTDVFNITLNAPGSYPAGTTFQLFQAGGAATLLDSNNDGVPDTGPVAPGATYNVVVKATLPATFSGTGPYVVNVTATSSNPGKPAATGTDTVTSITASTVEITNRNADNVRIGQGALTPTPVLTRASNPGTVVTFPLSANNQSANNDNYALSYSTTNPGSTVVPAGFSVVFRDGNGQVITNTGNIAPGGFFDYIAEVTIPANATPQDIALFFTITSGASGATDTIRDRLTVNTVAAISVTPNNQGQVFPGSSVNYAHTITNNGNAAQTNVAVATSNTQNGFSSVVYADTNGNGILDPAEQNAGPLASIPSLAPGANFPVIVVVFGPSNQFTNGAVNTTTLTATSDGGQTARATDTTTIVAGDVVLTKSQAVLAANGTTVISANSQGNASALPGQIIRYTILVRNTGGAPVTNVVVSDTTPAFTTYTTTGGAASYSINGGAAVAATTAPNSGSTGTITWTIATLAPGATATVTFNVLINN